MTDVNETKNPEAKPLSLEEQVDLLRDDIIVRDRITAMKEKELTNAFMMISQSIAVMSAKTDVALEYIHEKLDVSKEEMTSTVTTAIETTLKKQQEAIAEATQRATEEADA